MKFVCCSVLQNENILNTKKRSLSDVVYLKFMTQHSYIYISTIQELVKILFFKCKCNFCYFWLHEPRSFKTPCMSQVQYFSLNVIIYYLFNTKMFIKFILFWPDLVLTPAKTLLIEQQNIGRHKSLRDTSLFEVVSFCLSL